jgi:hypothetical protein
VATLVVIAVFLGKVRRLRRRELPEQEALHRLPRLFRGVADGRGKIPGRAVEHPGPEGNDRAEGDRVVTVVERDVLLLAPDRRCCVRGVVDGEADGLHPVQREPVLAEHTALVDERRPDRDRTLLRFRWRWGSCDGRGREGAGGD